MRVRLVDDPRAEVGEDVRRVGVGVGAVECQLYCTALSPINLLMINGLKK